MILNISALMERVTNQNSKTRPGKVSQSFYISKALLARLKNVLPSGTSASQMVEALLEEFVTVAEEANATKPSSHIGGKPQP